MPLKTVAPPAELIIVRASEIEPKDVQWTWDQVLVRGGLNLLAGIEGTGKSWLTLFIAAAISRGWALPGEDETDDRGRRWADYQGNIAVCDPRRVLIFNCEDTAEHVLVPFWHCPTPGVPAPRS